MAESSVPLNVTALDFSQGALLFQSHVFAQSNQSRNGGHTFCTIKGDATNLPVESETFDVVIDKGTVDSVLKDISTGSIMAGKVIAECVRVLCTSGVLLQMTDEDPDLRLALIDSLALSVTTNFKVVSTQQGQEYFLYQVKKTLTQI